MPTFKKEYILIIFLPGKSQRMIHVLVTPLGTMVFASVQLKSEEVTAKFEHFCVFLIFKLKKKHQDN